MSETIDGWLSLITGDGAPVGERKLIRYRLHIDRFGNADIELDPWRLPLDFEVKDEGIEGFALLSATHEVLMRVGLPNLPAVGDKVTINDY